MFSGLLHALTLVQSFRLVDPTKSGHRKLLPLFLVDPNINIISTADVPCQAVDWVEEMGPSGDSSLDHGHNGGRWGTRSMDEAKEHREALMGERKGFILIHQESTEGGAFVSTRCTWASFALGVGSSSDHGDGNLVSQLTDPVKEYAESIILTT